LLIDVLEDDIQSVLGYFVAENFSEGSMEDRPSSLRLWL
jgi:hypothetical protein